MVNVDNILFNITNNCKLILVMPAPKVRFSIVVESVPDLEHLGAPVQKKCRGPKFKNVIKCTTIY